MPPIVDVIDNPAQWIEAIRDAQTRPPRAVAAVSYLGRWETSSSPVLLGCSDGRDYAVKGSNAGKKAVNDQVIGRLARAMHAPVPRVALVEVPEELVLAEPLMGHIAPGLAHGSELERDSYESYMVEHASAPENRARYARLALLWGWTRASDRQYMYGEDPPHLVSSFDHSHFFPGGPDWTRITLNGRLAVGLDDELSHYCRFKPSEVEEAAKLLKGISHAHIARAVAAPPGAWGIDISERVALATFLAKRRIELLNLLTS